MGYAIDRAVRALSKGMLQRVGLAAALVHDPELLVLDEPMSGLDPVGRKEVRDLIVEEKQRGQDGVLLEPHPERRRDAVRPRVHPAARARWSCRGRCASCSPRASGGAR